MRLLYTMILLAMPPITQMLFTAYALDQVFRYEFRNRRAAYISTLAIGVLTATLIDVYRGFFATQIIDSDTFWDELFLMAGIVIHGIVMIILLNGKVWRRVIVVFMTSDIISSISTIFSGIRDQMFGFGSWTGESGKWMVFVVFGIAGNILECIFLFAIARIRRRSDNTPLPLPVIGIVMIVLQLFNGMVLDSGDPGEQPFDVGIVKVITLLLILLILLLFFYIRVTRKERDGLRDINRVNEELVETQARFFEESAKSDNEIRAIRHDMKNNIQVLMLLLEQGEYGKMREYLEEMGEGLLVADVSAHTGDTIADAIIADKKALASSHGLVLRSSGVISGVEISPVDMCKILANLLDNAIEAASVPELAELDPALRVIVLTFRKTDNFFMISVVNPCSAAPLIENGHIVTSKADRKDHGFGIRNIEAASFAYGGELVVTCEPKPYGFQFRAEVVIPVG
ncbi:GHKL domain-containing protein [Ruminococcaceae bacterium YRB3002]|nr:GHKL domain-containing protein [Ruminococcaceae bacterium YRB3002]